MRPIPSSVVGCLLAFLMMLPVLSPVMGQEHVYPGIDPANMDLSVDPGEDFYRFANGGWLDRTEIPSNQASFGVFQDLDNMTREQLLDLLRSATASGTLEEGSDPWKAAGMFQQGMDIEIRNALGVTPIQPLLDEIAGIGSLDDLGLFQQGAQFSGFNGLFSFEVAPDLKNSSMNAVYLDSAYLGLPNRDYYLDDDEDTVAVQDAYIATSAELLQYAGYDVEQAQMAAQAVYDFEYSLASTTLTREEEQNFELLYNPLSLADLAELYPLMDWDAYLANLELTGTDQILVYDPGYMEALPEIVTGTPLDVLKSYYTLELLWGAADFLGEDIGETVFGFEGNVLSGVAERRPLDERALDQVNGMLGDAIGQLYVDAYFPPEAKEEITLLVDDLIIAFGHRIDANSWMSAETKIRAHEKLDAMTVKVGYPDVWRSYDDVEVGDSYFESVLSVTQADLRRDLAKAGEPVDDVEWDDPPQTVNAYYNPIANEIVFPAGILQAPFFDYRADPAENFGAIGYVIGHEITHGFDLQGSQFDAHGNLADWWTEEDFARFTALNTELAEQYSAVEVLPGVFVNGQLTITENAADLGGLQIAYDALQVYLAEQGDADMLTTPAASPVISTPMASPVVAADALALTPQQQFFVSAATVWRMKTRDAALITQVRTDPHSPARIRATLPLQNMDAFHEAFGIGPGDAMYLQPADRLVIW